MKSLFSTPDNNEMVARIDGLNANSRAEWGKMNVAQMLAHTQQPLKVAFGELKLKCTLVGILFGSMAKKKLAQGEEPFKKNLPTDNNFIVKDSRNFDVEKKNLITLVQRFAQGGPDGISKEPHPFFGKLTTQEWDTLMWKHLDHHLRQFSA